MTTYRTTFTVDLIVATILGVVLTAASFAVALWAGWVDGVGLLEPFAVLTSYTCTYLCVRERRFNYPLGIISSAAYAVLFYRFDLNASAVLNAYLVPTLIYGWIRWRRDADTRPVTTVEPRMIPVYLAVTAVAWVGASLVSRAFGGTMAWTDSLILAGTILAQFLLDNKKVETWIVWAVVNVFAIYTYQRAGLPLAAFQYVFFLANTVYGWVAWNRSRSVTIESSAAAPAQAAGEAAAS